ncbi:MAPEG family protein [uncultured Sneathiella sp.]|uniref:MAPEG family protein n=1 Tax=uncultured Sneathiella sp. TaxID=879315 RepID=UPI0030EE0B0A|tara:strand:- start:7825 stop:8214 length:390 start_codon:yes stop_codon:yes gene_type:complete
MHVTITPIFAALLALIFVLLSIRTVRMRWKTRISMGDEGNVEMQRAIRAHANFIEYVPITLLLMLFLEMRAVSIYGVIAIGVLLFVGRCLHAIALSGKKMNFKFRASGMILTFTALIVGSLWLLFTYLI